MRVSSSARVGWGGEAVGAVVLAEGAEQAGDGLQAAAAGVLDGGEGAAGLVGGDVQESAGRAGLDDHDAHVVGDDVVQLAGDPGPLGGHGPVGLPLAVALGPLGPGRQLLGVGSPDPHVPAPGPHGAEEEQQVQDADPAGDRPVGAKADRPLDGHQALHGGQGGQRGPPVALGGHAEDGQRQPEVELAGREPDGVVGGVGGQHHPEHAHRVPAPPGERQPLEQDQRHRQAVQVHKGRRG
jgi:hypothetical protein